MNKKVIYTCIVGDYDTLKEPLVKTEGWDYICFTDQDFKSDNWKIVKLGRSDVKEQRRKKIYNEYILNAYEASIWLDGSMYINTDLDKFVLENCNSDFSLMKHPSRNCTYHEALACLQLNKDSKETIEQQVKGYKEEGFPSNEGMVATGVMYRKHTIEVKRLLIRWWMQVCEKSKRDQLSFNYVVWKHGYEYTTFPFTVLNKEFVITNHKK